MKNGNITEFLNRLSYGEELDFEYDGKEYFLQGWAEEDGTCRMTMFVVEDNPFENYDWECRFESMKECADAFLAAKIWNNRTFLQVEEEITWKD